MNWILPANGKLYDHARAFQKWGFITGDKITVSIKLVILYIFTVLDRIKR